MTKVLHTVWALLLNVCGFPIFRTCFANAMEDEECESLLLGPPFSSVLFSLAVYVIIINSTLFPRSFHEPKMVFLVLYEFLAAAFILEFAMACIWTPIDVLLSTTLPTNLSRSLKQLGLDAEAAWLVANKTFSIVATYTVSITVFLLSLHVTDAVDYTIISDCGVMPFVLNIQERLWDRMQREFPFPSEEAKFCRCKVRKRRRSKSHVNSSK